MYYRWAFAPSDGHVLLSDNTEDPPRFHSDLAREINEPSTYHGYAYRIGRGWRITDWDHKTVNDPYVIGQVIREIRKKEGAVLPHPDLTAWEETGDEPSFDNFHYGLPV
jgi:hypothetical protein